jgi:HD-like signal output (HDOD) protein
LFLQLVAELKSPRASTATVAAIIAKDVAMTAELLKLSNSSYFAVKSTGSTALQAVRMLGLDIVQTLVLQIGVFKQFSGTPELEKRLDQINHYSHALGSLAQKVAQAAGEPDHVAKAAHCAALLSVIGALILLHGKEAAYLELLATVGPDNPLHDAEIAKFGSEHTLIGAKLLSNWGFADNVVEAVAYSSVPGEAQSLRNPLLTALHVARVLGPNMPLVPVGDYCSVILDRPYLEELGHLADLENWLALVVPSKKSGRG